MEKMAASEVKLLVYDLSHGMARSLSAQFLGGPEHAIDIIPHTSLLVYGKEYYFGGGIQCCEPHEFRASRQLSPIEVIALGSTTTPRADHDQTTSTEDQTTTTSMKENDAAHEYHMFIIRLASLE